MNVSTYSDGTPLRIYLPWYLRCDPSSTQPWVQQYPWALALVLAVATLLLLLLILHFTPFR